MFVTYQKRNFTLQNLNKEYLNKEDAQDRVLWREGIWRKLSNPCKHEKTDVKQ